MSIQRGLCRGLQPRHEARAALLKKLNEVKVAEEEKGKAERDNILRSSLEYVKSKFLGSLFARLLRCLLC